MPKSEYPRRSPIKEAPLRLPGQSLQNSLNDLLGEQLLPWALLPGFGIAMTVMEWGRLFTGHPITRQSAIGMTIFGLLCCIVGAVQLRRKWHEVQAIRLGLEGEITIGLFLEEHCRIRGYHVLHDVPGEGFNVDHVIIGTGGIFSVETKTHSKPTRGGGVVKYDGESILIDGHAPDRDPLVQAKAGASHIRGILSRLTGRDPRSIPVRPIVLYPGWYIEGKSGGKEVWVLHEKSLPAFLDYEPDRLTSEDVALYYARLGDEVRNKSN